MLLPYCAKPAWCDYRHTDDCGECGGCTVGDLYRMAYERGMIPITITSFEMLRDTLRWCAENGYTYIGHCCYEFYEKRYEIFRKAKDWGANGVLIDIAGTTCYSLGVEEEEKAYRGEFQVELDLLVEDSEKILSLKNKVEESNKRKQKERPEPVEELREFLPEYYKMPKAVSGPEEDRTRSSMVKGDIRGSSFVGGKEVSHDKAIEEIAHLILESRKPAVIVGPLVLWNWDKDSRKKAKLIRKLKDLLPKLNVLVLPDYRPKNKGFDPSREVDPPNPHLSIIHGDHDLTVLIGVHCYRTDFIVRLLRKRTDTKVIALCNLHGHPEADVSLSGLTPEILEKLVNLIGSRSGLPA